MLGCFRLIGIRIIRKLFYCMRSAAIMSANEVASTKSGDFFRINWPRRLHYCVITGSRLTEIWLVGGGGSEYGEPPERAR